MNTDLRLQGFYWVCSEINVDEIAGVKYDGHMHAMVGSRNTKLRRKGIPVTIVSFTGTTRRQSSGTCNKR